MTKIHLLMKKEEIDSEKLADGNKVAVVLDVLLATTTIVWALKNGAKEVIPVLHSGEAMEMKNHLQEDSCIIAGELKAKPIEGFVYPSPTILEKLVKDKSLILSTTNGTVALRKASAAKKVYIASIINNPAVAAVVQEDSDVDTVLVVCSGNSGEVSLEDFYGAGHLIHCLLRNGSYELSDAAKAAHFLYQGQKDAYEVLRSSYVGQLFEKYDDDLDLQLASSKGSSSIVPILQNGKVIIDKIYSV